MMTIKTLYFRSDNDIGVSENKSPNVLQIHPKVITDEKAYLRFDTLQLYRGVGEEQGLWIEGPWVRDDAEDQ